MRDYVYQYRDTFSNPKEILEINNSFVFPFEEKYFNINTAYDGIGFFQRSWHTSFYFAIAYILAVHGGQKLMKNREKFNLSQILVAWNVCLAVFSIVGTVRFLPYFFNTLSTKGFDHSVCVVDYEFGVSGCWTILFGLSKIVDLVDTGFVVLRKQKLIFLHWYHHASTLIYTWYSINQVNSTGRWFIAMNLFVHSIMYSYYALRALRVRIPRAVNVMITSMQIAQMIVGISVNVHAYNQKKSGKSCQVSFNNIYWSFFIYFTFFVLFFNFFRNAYLKRRSDKLIKENKEN